MSRKRASLAGKGAEILFGAAAEDSDEASLPPEDQDAAPAEDSTAEPWPPDKEDAAPAEEPTAEPLPADDQEAPVVEEHELPEEAPCEEGADWQAGLAEEAASAVGAGEGEDEIPPGPLDMAEEPPEGMSPAGGVLVIAGEVELPDESMIEELPLLATTPAQPAEELPLLATTPAQPAEELPPLATTPAQPAETLPSFDLVPAHPAVPEEEPVSLGPVADLPEVETEASTPPAPMYTEPVPMPEVPPTLPPPREKPEAYEPALRARVYGAIYDAYTAAPPEERLLPDGPSSPAMMLPEIEEYEVNQPSHMRDEETVLRVVSAEQRRFLWDKVFRLYEEVPDVLCMDELQDEALQLLQGAQDILMEKPRQFDVALYKVSQAESIINRRRNIDRWTNTYGWATFMYEMVWLVVLAAAILFAPAVVNWVEAVVGDVPYFISVSGLWMTAAWGSAGGVLGALYSLYWHAAKVKDFQKQYLMWYVVQPVIGILIGAFVYLITGAGFIGATGENVVTGETSVIPLFRYAIAAIASFRQRFILEVVDRVIQLLTSPFQSPEKPSETEEQPAES